MRFISKSSNLLIVLKPGLSAQPLTGTPAMPTVSVRFKEGLADVPDGPLTEMMLAHPGYEGDFISAESVNDVDPYAYNRQETEPQHIVTELKYGSPVARHVEGGKTKLPPEMAKLVQEMATSMAKEMLPTMVESVLRGIVEKSGVATPAAAPVAKVKGKPGRKPGSAKKNVLPSSPTSYEPPAAIQSDVTA